MYEKKNIQKTYFAMLYGNEPITVKDVNKLLDIVWPEHQDWLHGGHRDYYGGLLCYECAEELIGPGAGEVNDLKSIDPDRPTSQLVCNWCGPGNFNALGKRLAN